MRPGASLPSGCVVLKMDAVSGFGLAREGVQPTTSSRLVSGQTRGWHETNPAAAAVRQRHVPERPGRRPCKVHRIQAVDRCRNGAYGIPRRHYLWYEAGREIVTVVTVALRNASRKGRYRKACHGRHFDQRDWEALAISLTPTGVNAISARLHRQFVPRGE
jgi:hypothetical protein